MDLRFFACSFSPQNRASLTRGGHVSSHGVAAESEADMEKYKTLYVCDRKKCEHCCTECKHTADINHAKYDSHYQFEPGRDGTLWEVIRK